VDSTAAGKVAEVARDVADKTGSDDATGGMEAAMAGLSVHTQPVDSSSSEGASAASSSSVAESRAMSAAAAAAVASKSTRKKRNGKKGAKKASQLSMCKELVLYDHQTIKCGALSAFVLVGLC